MHILVVVENYPTASELFIQREIETLGSFGHRVTVLACAKANVFYHSKKSPKPASNKPKIYQVFKLLAAFPLPALRWSGRVQKALSQLDKPDIVHAHFASVTAYCANALTNYWQVPLTISAHARDVFVPRQPGIAMLKEAAKVFTCSKAAERKISKLMPEHKDKIRLLYHGIPASYSSSPIARNTNLKILAAGRLLEKKGFHILINAFSRLLQSIPLAKLIVAGQGVEKKKLVNLTASLKIQDSVKFTGLLRPEELKQIMTECQLLCAPGIVAKDKDCDGVQNVVLEAMALGLPVVASQTGGLPEVIQAQDTGFLVPAGAAEKLAEKLKECLKNPAQCHRVAVNARLFVQNNFDLNENIKKLESELKALI